MTNRPVTIALLWHMHQPFYKDLVSGEYILPWVRLHAVKDYYDMAALIERFPEAKAVFNLVPSLFSQIEDYVNNNVRDRFLDLSMKSPSDLELDEKVFILQNFFMANWDTMINPYPRYLDLLLKRGRFVSHSELMKVARRFSTQEMLDLQVWFNLTWFGFIYKNEDPVIVEMIRKGKYFTQEDKELVIKKQFEVMGKIIPKYRELSLKGQIELTTTPFYHPILPLLCDTNVAKESMPYAKLPDVAYRHPEDAKRQIEMAVAYHTEKFGGKPSGMWPSEGSVSEAIIPLVAGAGIKWIATDEAILSRSLQKMGGRSHSLSAQELYQPYYIEKDGAGVAGIFRNHFLSDQVGFVYHRWNTHDSICDFNHHINNIKISLPDDGQNYLISVILDGENAWEYYEGGGKKFLEAFYSNLSSNSMVRTARVSEFIEENPPRKKLTHLYAGSWINNNFKIWIGHQEDNKAWDYLNQARLALDGYKGENEELAWQELFIAEGSDWCWWYGDDHSSENDAAFDALFRKHLKNVYLLIGRTPPKNLDVPIKSVSVIKPIKEPVYLIHPILDGEVTNYYEWLSAGIYDISKASGAMHQIETLLKGIYFGFSQTDFYVRLGVYLDLSAEEAKAFSFSITTTTPAWRKIELAFDCEKNAYAMKVFGQDNTFIKELTTFGIASIIEIGIPFEIIEAKPCDRVDFSVEVCKDGQELERWPRGSGISFSVPSESYAQEQWYV